VPGVLEAGTYRLVFFVSSGFFSRLEVEFTVADPAAIITSRSSSPLHVHHIPRQLISPSSPPAEATGDAPRAGTRGPEAMLRLTVDQLAGLFEGRTRFVTRLAEYDDPLRHARAILTVPAPSRCGGGAQCSSRASGRRALSTSSAAEQGQEDDPAILEELAKLNRAYEESLASGSSCSSTADPAHVSSSVLRERYARTREEELATAVEDLVADRRGPVPPNACTSSEGVARRLG